MALHLRWRLEINAYRPPIASSWAFLGIALERSLREEKMVAPMVITPLKATVLKPFMCCVC